MKKQTARYKRFTRSRFGNFMYFFFLIAAGLFMIIPLVYSVITSFKPLDELLAFPPKFYVVRPTFKNYEALPELLSNLEVPLSRYVFNTLFVSFGLTFLQVITSALAAFTMCQVKHKFMGVYYLVIQFALLYNGTTLAVPQYLIISKMGIIDTFWAYLLPPLAGTMGVFLIKQFMESSIPHELIEAARIDGAGAGRMFWQIVIPLSKPALLTWTLFAFQGAWATGSGPTIFSESLKTLPSVMTSVVSSGLARSGSAMAVTVVMMIPPILMYMITQSNVLETMGTAGLKD
ncbi:MAG: carbohydrate ABC transporter permease [Ruminococcaceae bacterium]|nr:carbohydrate ABC transporter permease [Oscillospiraceae bacterium]